MNDLEIIELKNKASKLFLKLEAWSTIARTEKGRQELLECAREASEIYEGINELDKVITFKLMKDESD